MTVGLWEPERSAAARRRTFVVAVLALFVATILQMSVIARLGLPGGRPDLVLMTLAAVALVEGPVTGALLGFVTGLLGDLMSAHVVGQSALVLCLVGYLAGLVLDVTRRSVAVPLVAVCGAVAGGTLGYFAIAALLGDAVVSPGQAIVRSLAAALYAVLITPFLFPVVQAGLRRCRGVRG
jgi:rod shape-determining protein MreD